ncbi:MAG: hypothetical protein ABFD75_14200 [Smithella sp.]
MNDYFQYLIDRSTGQTPAIRPRFPSIFEFPDVPVTAGDDLAAGIINGTPGRMDRTPAAHPGRSPAMELPDAPDSIAVADFKSEIIHQSREKTGIDQEATAAAPYEVLPGKETSPKLTRDKASEKHIKDTKGATASSLYEDTVRIFSSDTVNSVHQEAAIKNVRLQAATPDLQSSAVGDDGANQKTDTLPSTRDEVKRMAKLFSSTEPLIAASTLAPDSKHVHDSFAGVMQQPKVRPLIADSPMSPAFIPQEARPEKTIKVTIGRIEVRAVMPQAPLSQPRTSPQEPQPKISLEDYLKKQRGGSR